MTRARKPAAGQPSLFDAAAPAPKKPARANPLGPWFDAIAGVVGPTAVKAANGRVARIAKGMRDAGVAPERVADLGAVVRRYAPWRKTIDLGTVQACWPWLVEPPPAAGPAGGGEVGAMLKAIHDNGGEAPF